MTTDSTRSRSRMKLSAFAEGRYQFKATVGRYGCKRGWKGRTETTLCLVDVIGPDGTLVTDHLWVNVGSQLFALNPQPGDVVTFLARAEPYEAGYLGYRDDVDCPIRRSWQLVRPTKWAIITGD